MIDHGHERQDDRDDARGRPPQASGKTVFVGGNIGRPLIGFADGPQEETAVVEVSSFSFSGRDLPSRHRDLLNVTCDHVDYHGSFSAYREGVFCPTGTGISRS